MARRENDTSPVSAGPERSANTNRGRATVNAASTRKGRRCKANTTAMNAAAMPLATWIVQAACSLAIHPCKSVITPKTNARATDPAAKTA